MLLILACAYAHERCERRLQDGGHERGVHLTKCDVISLRHTLSSQLRESAVLARVAFVSHCWWRHSYIYLHTDGYIGTAAVGSELVMQHCKLQHFSCLLGMSSERMQDPSLSSSQVINTRFCPAVVATDFLDELSVLQDQWMDDPIA